MGASGGGSTARWLSQFVHDLAPLVLAAMRALVLACAPMMCEGWGASAIASAAVVVAAGACTNASSGTSGSPEASARMTAEGRNAPDAGDGASGEASSGISIPAAFAGACRLSFLDVDAAGCGGVEAYADCAMRSCGIDACENGACSDYAACLADASEPCAADCSPSPTCTCLQTVVACATAQCLGALSCGPTVDGGACDMLDLCCAGQPQQDQGSCRQAASVARVRGDSTCQELLDLPPDSGVFYTCPAAP